MKEVYAILSLAGLAVALPGPMPANVLVKRSTSSVSTSTTSTSTTPAASTSGPAYCYGFANPDAGIAEYCTCSDGGKYSVATGSVVCPYTDPVPTSLTITSLSSYSSTTSTTTSTTPAAIPTECAYNAQPDGDCWDDLDLTTYVENWASTTDCSAYPNGFADCWYYLETPYSPDICAQINVDAACQKPNWPDFNPANGDSEAVQKFWVTWAIFNTNSFFANLYTAINAASSPASDIVGSLVTTYNPPVPQNTAVDALLDALTFGLSLYAEGSVLVKALLRSAPQTTGLLGKLFPTGSTDQTVSTWADVQAAVGDFVKSWSSSVADGLPLIAGDATTFANFASAAAITSAEPALDTLATSIYQALGAQVVSGIWNDLNLAVCRGADTSVVALQTNGSDILWDTGCTSYDSSGLCGLGYFYDGTDTYSLVNPNNMFQNYDTDLENLFGGDSPITTGALLFTGSLLCSQTCGANGGCTPSISQTDPTQASCIANLRVCTWTIYDVGPFEPGCDNNPASDAVLPGFGVDGCVGDPDSTTSWDVPNTYLGGGIWTNPPENSFWYGEDVCNNENNL